MADCRNEPYEIEVEAGETRVFCTCDRSASPPFCDGAHKGTGCKPKVVSFETDKRLLVCGCGRSDALPYCDGAHSLIVDR